MPSFAKHWFQRLCLGSAGVLISSFGPDQVPTAWKPVLLWFGVAMAIFAVILWPLVSLLWKRISAGRQETLPPTLYVRNTEAKSPHFEDKMFRISWVEKDLSLTFRGEGSDGFDDDKPIQEPTLTFELFNAGDEAVRHVVARWKLPNVDPQDDVKLLGANVRSFDGRHLKMQNEKGSASILTVSLGAESEPIPMIASGSAAVLKAPTAFTTAYSIRALGRAKRQAEKHSKENPDHDPLKVLEDWGEPMDRAYVELSYAKGERMSRHSFFIVGIVWGGSPPHISSYDTKTSQVVMEHTPGIVAVIDHVGVIHDEERP